MVDPLEFECGACLASPGEWCHSVSADSDVLRKGFHRMRAVQAAKGLCKCGNCGGLGWVPAFPENDTDTES